MFRGRLTGLRLGPYMLRQPVVSFSANEHLGLLASPDIGALIGGAILERFVVTFDLPHRRIFIEPNSHFHDAFAANESGIALLAHDGRLEVAGVESGSPGERAGVRDGDVVIEIDHRPASELDLQTIDGLLQPARNVPMTFRRGGKTLQVVVNIVERM